MLKVKVAFTREVRPDLVSRGIMKFMGANYSHVFFILDEFIYHATGEGVNRKRLSEYLQTHVIDKEYEVVLELMSHDSFKAYMAGANAKEYSESQYLGFLLPFFQKFVRNGSQKQICSELVSEVLRDFGPMELPKEQDFMSPKDVDDMLKRELSK